VEFWAAPLSGGLLTNNLGAYFTVKPIERSTDEILVREAQMKAETVVTPVKKGEWTRVSGSFQARYEAEHIVIGNFSDDEHTRFQVVSDTGYNYAYYYIDDVLVKKIPPYLPPPVPPDDLSVLKPEKGKTYQLKNIFFEFDRHELMPRSYVELHKLLGVLRANPKFTIEIIGHTDNIGSDAYNEDLSLKRAQSVVRYLTQNGIPAGRLKFRGDGEKNPVSSNQTDEGRAQNRRVEFRVI
jgi:outer membrane protein OmpA-like peptidoglycan-associated protein